MVSTIGIVSLSSGIIGETFCQARRPYPTTQRPRTQSYLFLPSFPLCKLTHQRTSRSSREIAIQPFGDSVDMIAAPPVNDITLANYLLK